MGKYSYRVTYDYLIAKQYHEQGKVVFADNAKEAKKIIMDRYWDNVAAHGRREVRYPFHLTAKRVKD